MFWELCFSDTWSSYKNLCCGIKVRQKAVKDAWKAEKRLVERTGCGSRRWTKKELKELKETGKVKDYEGHHINSVKGHP